MNQHSTAMPTARAGVPSGLSRLASQAKPLIAIAGEWLHHLWRRTVPATLCLAGGAIWKMQEGWHAGIGLVVALMFWAFALDLMSDRAAGRAKVDMASRFFAMATDDHEITITTTHEYRADEATRIAVQALKDAQAMSAGTAETGTGSGQSPPARSAPPMRPDLA